MDPTSEEVPRTLLGMRRHSSVNITQATEAYNIGHYIGEAEALA